LGAIALIAFGLLIYVSAYGLIGLLTSGLMYAGCFVVLLAIVGYTLFTHGRKFVVLTNKRVVMRHGMGAIVSIRFETIISVSSQLNPLQCRRELTIRRRMSRGKPPKVDFIDSLRELDYVEEVINANIRTPEQQPPQPSAESLFL